jgi:hypothetical protein
MATIIVAALTVADSNTTRPHRVSDLACARAPGTRRLAEDTLSDRIRYPGIIQLEGAPAVLPVTFWSAEDTSGYARLPRDYRRLVQVPVTAGAAGHPCWPVYPPCTPTHRVDMPLRRPLAVITQRGTGQARRLSVDQTRGGLAPYASDMYVHTYTKPHDITRVPCCIMCSALS